MRKANDRLVKKQQAQGVSGLPENNPQVGSAPSGRPPPPPLAPSIVVRNGRSGMSTWAWWPPPRINTHLWWRHGFLHCYRVGGGSVSRTPVSSMHLSPVMTRPKRDFIHRRVIMDLSWPKGASVNDGVCAVHAGRTKPYGAYDGLWDSSGCGRQHIRCAFRRKS